MSTPYKINILNSLVFIGCGLVGFIAHYLRLGDYQQNALIPFVLGVLLLVMTPSLKSGSAVITKVVTVLTLLFGIIVLALLVQNMGSDQASARRMILLTIIALSSFASFGMYLNIWMEERRKG